MGNYFAFLFEMKDFFFGRSAVQNYMSEIFGIAITLVIVDRIIKRRDKNRLLPIKHISYSILWQNVDKFLSEFLPIEFINERIVLINFGEYRCMSIFEVKSVEEFEIISGIRRDLKLERELNEILNEDNDLFWAELKSVNIRLENLKRYESSLGELIVRFGSEMDRDLILLVHDISFEIKQYFFSYKSEVENYNETSLGFLIPNLTVKVIGLRNILLTRCEIRRSWF